MTFATNLTLSCAGTGKAVVKIGHSNLRPGSKELKTFTNVLHEMPGEIISAPGSKFSITEYQREDAIR